MFAAVRQWAEFLCALLYLTRPISDIVLDFIHRVLLRKTKPLPPIENKILLLPATEMAEKIRKQQLKCEDVMRAYVDRSRAVHPIINAVVDARYEDALEDSRVVDRFLQRGEKSPDEIEESTPLLGVPFSCKEAVGVKDLAQTAGIVEIKKRKAPKDSAAAALYRAAGAIPVTVTNVPEFCMWWDSTNFNFGMTKNPYNNSRTVGGSSGGEAANLTAAGALIGIGDDIGGSIRIPSAFCGIYGHKPSSGAVSNYCDFPQLEMDNEEIDAFISTGPMCRYAKDLPLLLKVLSNDNKRLRLQEKVNFRKVKVYYMEEFPGKYLKSLPAVRKSIREAAGYFEAEYGIKPVPIRMEELEHAIYIWECKILETNVMPFKTGLADKKGRVNLWWELLKSIFRLSNHTLSCIFFAMIERTEKDQFYFDCLKRYDEIERKFQEIFQEDAIFLVPSHPEPSPHYHTTIPKYCNIGYTAIFSILGFPVTNIPAGMCDGLPIGIQAVSGHFKDHLTIAAALELDKLFGGWKSP